MEPPEAVNAVASLNDKIGNCDPWSKEIKILRIKGAGPSLFPTIHPSEYRIEQFETPNKFMWCGHPTTDFGIAALFVSRWSSSVCVDYV